MLCLCACVHCTSIFVDSIFIYFDYFEHLIIFLTRHVYASTSYPRFTMVMQALASIVVGIDCLCQLVPDVYFDTTGAAFSYPAARLLAGCTVISYTHYPMISVVSACRTRHAWLHRQRAYFDIFRLILMRLTHSVYMTLLVACALGHVESRPRAEAII
jgi:hypothetical protein